MFKETSGRRGCRIQVGTHVKILILTAKTELEDRFPYPFSWNKTEKVISRLKPAIKVLSSSIHSKIEGQRNSPTSQWAP